MYTGHWLAPKTLCQIRLIARWVDKLCVHLSLHWSREFNKGNVRGVLLLKYSYS